MVKILHYYLLTLMLLMLSIGARAEDKTVTFVMQLDKSLTTDGFSITKDGVTITVYNTSSGSFQSSYLKINQGKPFTVSCSAGNIKKIVLTGYNDTRFDPDKLEVTDGGGTYNTSTGIDHQCEWTGDAASVTFTVPSNVRRVYLTKVEATYSTGSAPGEKQNPGLAFSSANASAVLGYSFTAPTLTQPDGLAVTYTSSNTNVATVNASTGEVAPLAVGTTTITASSAETDAYVAGEASYTLTVLALNGNGSTDNPYTVADLKKLNEINMFPTSSVSVKGIISGIYAFINTGYWNEMDYYISDDGSTDNQYLVKGRGLDYAKFNAKEDLMVGSKVILTGTPNDMSEFNYDELTSIEVPVSIVDGEYATFYYGGFNLKVPAGVTATTYSYANNALTTSKTYNEGDVIPAKTAVVLKGNAATYYFQGTTETGETPIFSNLHGFDKDATTSVEGMGKYYMLSLNAQSDPASIGFYWGADGGGAFTSKAHKAYLALPASANVKGFAFNDVTNGITAKTTTEQADAPVYSLTGLRMSGPLPAGVYVRNGKKFIVK